MSEHNIKLSIISDLVKVDKYRSHLNNPERFFSQEHYSDRSIDDLKRIHDIYVRYLLDYSKLGEPYPTVIENLEYRNQEIDKCISNKKVKVK